MQFLKCIVIARHTV